MAWKWNGRLENTYPISKFCVTSCCMRVKLKYLFMYVCKQILWPISVLSRFDILYPDFIIFQNWLMICQSLFSESVTCFKKGSHEFFFHCVINFGHWIQFGSISILRMDWVVESRKWPFLLTFSTVFMLIRWMGSKKTKNILT